MSRMVIGSVSPAVVRFANLIPEIDQPKTLLSTYVISVSDDVSNLCRSISTCKMNENLDSRVYHGLIVTTSCRSCRVPRN